MVELKDFSSLVDLYYAKVFYHCLKIIKNNHDSSDITQNTFTKAFINIKNLKKTDSFGAWIFTICNSEIKLFYRNKQKNISNSLNLDMANIPAKSSKTNKYDNLYSAIEVLDEKYKNLIILKYFAEFSVKEIATLTGINENLVKSRLYDARKKLENLLSNSENSTDLINIYNLNRERKKEIMSTAKLMELGLNVIPRMSAWGQGELMKCAENNEKFSNEVLTELAKIEKGNEFTVECGGKLSYDEFVRLLAYNQDVLYHLKQDSDKLRHDIANYLGTGGYICGMEFILHVPSLKDTADWYKKHLGWHSDYSEDYPGHAMIRICNSEDQHQCFMIKAGFHISPAEEGNTPKNVSMFIFLEGKSMVKTREKIKNTGWNKISDISNGGFGAMTFSLEDLNGVKLQFLEWIPDNPEEFEIYKSYLKEHGIDI